MVSCKNCDSALEPDFRFCPVCGQKSVDLERPLAELLADAMRDFLDVDGRVVRTLWTLLRHPGVLTREFLAGRRRTWLPPVRLYLVISVGFFLLTAWVAGKGALLSEGQTLEADAPGQARLFADYVPQLMFVLLPVFALLLKAAFRTRLYFHHLVHALHLHSAAYIVLALMLPLEQAAGKVGPAMFAQIVLFGYLMAGLVVSVRRVYVVSWLAAGGKVLAVLIAYMMLVAGTLEGVSHLTMPETRGLPFLTD